MTVWLRHEARSYRERPGTSFGPATLTGLDQLERIDGPSDLLYVVYASTYEEAMQIYYDREDWGVYRTIPGVTDQPYGEDLMRKQLAEYPDDLELRLLNGQV